MFSFRGRQLLVLSEGLAEIIELSLTGRDSQYCQTEVYQICSCVIYYVPTSKYGMIKEVHYGNQGVTAIDSCR